MQTLTEHTTSSESDPKSQKTTFFDNKHFASKDSQVIPQSGGNLDNSQSHDSVLPLVVPQASVPLGDTSSVIHLNAEGMHNKDIIQESFSNDVQISTEKGEKKEEKKDALSNQGEKFHTNFEEDHEIISNEFHENFNISESDHKTPPQDSFGSKVGQDCITSIQYEEVSNLGIPEISNKEIDLNAFDTEKTNLNKTDLTSSSGSSSKNNLASIENYSFQGDTGPNSLNNTSIDTKSLQETLQDQKSNNPNPIISQNLFLNASNSILTDSGQRFPLPISTSDGSDVLDISEKDSTNEKNFISKIVSNIFSFKKDFEQKNIIKRTTKMLIFIQDEEKQQPLDVEKFDLASDQRLSQFLNDYSDLLEHVAVKEKVHQFLKNRIKSVFSKSDGNVKDKHKAIIFLFSSLYSRLPQFAQTFAIDALNQYLMLQIFEESKEIVIDGRFSIKEDWKLNVPWQYFKKVTASAEEKKLIKFLKDLYHSFGSNDLADIYRGLVFQKMRYQYYAAFKDQNMELQRQLTDFYYDLAQKSSFIPFKEKKNWRALWAERQEVLNRQEVQKDTTQLNVDGEFLNVKRFSDDHHTHQETENDQLNTIEISINEKKEPQQQTDSNDLIRYSKDLEIEFNMLQASIEKDKQMYVQESSKWTKQDVIQRILLTLRYGVSLPEEIIRETAETVEEKTMEFVNCDLRMVAISPEKMTAQNFKNLQLFSNRALVRFNKKNKFTQQNGDMIKKLYYVKHDKGRFSYHLINILESRIEDFDQKILSDGKMLLKEKVSLAEDIIGFELEGVHRDKVFGSISRLVEKVTQEKRIIHWNEICLYKENSYLTTDQYSLAYAQTVKNKDFEIGRMQPKQTFVKAQLINKEFVEKREFKNQDLLIHYLEIYASVFKSCAVKIEPRMKDSKVTYGKFDPALDLIQPLLEQALALVSLKIDLFSILDTNDIRELSKLMVNLNRLPVEYLQKVLPGFLILLLKSDKLLLAQLAWKSIPNEENFSRIDNLISKLSSEIYDEYTDLVPAAAYAISLLNTKLSLESVFKDGKFSLLMKLSKSSPITFNYCQSFLGTMPHDLPLSNQEIYNKAALFARLTYQASLNSRTNSRKVIQRENTAEIFLENLLKQAVGNQQGEGIKSIYDHSIGILNDLSFQNLLKLPDIDLDVLVYLKYYNRLNFNQIGHIFFTISEHLQNNQPISEGLFKLMVSYLDTEEQVKPYFNEEANHLLYNKEKESQRSKQAYLRHYPEQLPPKKIFKLVKELVKRMPSTLKFSYTKAFVNPHNPAFVLFDWCWPYRVSHHEEKRKFFVNVLNENFATDLNNKDKDEFLLLYRFNGKNLFDPYSEPLTWELYAELRKAIILPDRQRSGNFYLENMFATLTRGLKEHHGNKEHALNLFIAILDLLVMNFQTEQEWILDEIQGAIGCLKISAKFQQPLSKDEVLQQLVYEFLNRIESFLTQPFLPAVRQSYMKYAEVWLKILLENLMSLISSDYRVETQKATQRKLQQLYGWIEVQQDKYKMVKYNKLKPQKINEEKRVEEHGEGSEALDLMVNIEDVPFMEVSGITMDCYKTSSIAKIEEWYGEKLYPQWGVKGYLITNENTYYPKWIGYIIELMINDMNHQVQYEKFYQSTLQAMEQQQSLKVEYFVDVNAYNESSIMLLAKSNCLQLVETLLKKFDQKSQLLLLIEKNIYQQTFLHYIPKIHIIHWIKSMPQLPKEVLVHYDEQQNSWLTVTIKEDNPELFKAICDRFQDMPDLLNQLLLAKNKEGVDAIEVLLKNKRLAWLQPYARCLDISLFLNRDAKQNNSLIHTLQNKDKDTFQEIVSLFQGEQLKQLFKQKNIYEANIIFYIMKEIEKILHSEKQPVFLITDEGNAIEVQEAKKKIIRNDQVSSNEIFESNSDEDHDSRSNDSNLKRSFVEIVELCKWITPEQLVENFSDNPLGKCHPQYTYLHYVFLLALINKDNCNNFNHSLNKYIGHNLLESFLKALMGDQSSPKDWEYVFIMLNHSELATFKKVVLKFAPDEQDRIAAKENIEDLIRVIFGKAPKLDLFEKKTYQACKNNHMPSVNAKAFVLDQRTRTLSENSNKNILISYWQAGLFGHKKVSPNVPKSERVTYNKNM